MSNKKTSVEAKKNRKSASQRNSKVAGKTPPTVLGQTLDDKFGGRKVSKQGRNSIQAIQKQVDDLEKILTTKE
jgi:hypothetical protein